MQWAVTSSLDFLLATFLQVMILLGTGGANGGGYSLSKYGIIGLHAGILILQGLINCLPIAWLAMFGVFSAAWNCVGTLCIVKSFCIRGFDPD